VVFLKLLDQYPLVSIVASQAIGGYHDPGIKLTTLGTVAQAIQRRTSQPRPPDAFLSRLMRGSQTPPLLTNIEVERLKLTGDRSFVLLIGG
jgi:hypothetical protein